MALAMLKRRIVPPDIAAFAGLPVTRVTLRDPSDSIAVHVAGRLGKDRTPLVCLSGYHRNMADFADFAPLYARLVGAGWPLVLIDLMGRGRSSDRRDRRGYITTNDARDVAEVLVALGIERAVLLGQAYGGQVTMALAAERPLLVAGAVLIDAGPLSAPRGLVRLRNNLGDLDGLRSEAGFRSMFRRMLSADYPNQPDTMLDAIAARTHYLDRHGRVRGLFDPALVKLLDAFEYDDVLVAQWPLFHALDHVPLMVMRTELTDLLRRETFEEMLRRRPDAEGYIIEAQSSPALLHRLGDVEPVTSFFLRARER
jgi:pimeloyl-ACP methyl ester carboxylesterase